MIEIDLSGSFPVGYVWWAIDWTDTVAEILANWDPNVLGPGLIQCYGYDVWIANTSDLISFCQFIVNWSNEGYPTKP